MRLYTKTGDDGTTGLIGGARAAKDDVQIDAYGTVDELNAQLGVLMAGGGLPAELRPWIERVQNDLFDVGADLSVPPDDDRERLRVAESQTAWLEERCDEVNERLEPLRSFLLPGGSVAGAQLHVCRTICRRAERRALEVDGASPEVVRYLNRLSDLLFILARGAHEGDEPLWQPGASQKRVS